MNNIRKNIDVYFILNTYFVVLSRAEEVEITARKQECLWSFRNLGWQGWGVHLRKFHKSYILVLIVENVIFFPQG